ncbi:MAG: DUF6474 family protein [Gordonia sp. (in: high G+C Gram-positive bacteria)]
MGLLSARQVKRAERKAEAKIRKAEHKAIKVKARVEAEASHRAERRERRKALHDEQKHHSKTQRAERKTHKAAGKAQKKASKAEVKTIAAQAKADEKAAAKAGVLAPVKVKRYLTVGRMLAPVAAPLAYRAAIAARQQIAEAQARRAGVSASVLSQYGGPSATLRARIDSARTTATKVAGTESTAEGREFVAAMSKRLDNLLVATDAADTMPPSQRRAAQRAIENELTAIDNDLLARLNVHP